MPAARDTVPIERRSVDSGEGAGETAVKRWDANTMRAAVLRTSFPGGRAGRPEL